MSSSLLIAQSLLLPHDLMQQRDHRQHRSEPDDRHRPGDADLQIAFQGKLPRKIHDGQNRRRDASDRKERTVRAISEKIDDAGHIAPETAADHQIVIIKDKRQCRAHDRIFHTFHKGTPLFIFIIGISQKGAGSTPWTAHPWIFLVFFKQLAVHVQRRLAMVRQKNLTKV